MSAINQNATIWAGDTVILRWPVYTPDGLAANFESPQGEFALGAAATPADGETPLITKSSPGAGGLIDQQTVNGVSGVWVFTASLLEADTQGITPVDHYYEVRIIDGDTVLTVATGVLTIKTTIIR